MNILDAFNYLTPLTTQEQKLITDWPPCAYEMKVCMNDEQCDLECRCMWIQDDNLYRCLIRLPRD